MPIQSVIREKRKELGLTQEQVAVALGVSAPAVNKWEKGATYPDFSLLAPLARLLEVDLNALLCFQEGLSEEEIGRFVKALGETVRTDGLDAGFALGLKKAKEYPSCGALLHQTALALDGALILLSAMSAGEKKPYEEQLLALYQRAADCGDGAVQVNAKYMLCSKYMGLGDYARARELADSLPPRSAIDKRTFQAALLIKEERFAAAGTLLEHKLLADINEVQMLLLNLSDLAAREGDGETAAQIAALSRSSAELFGLGTYHACLAPLQVALARKDAPECVALLDRLLSAAGGPWGPEKTPLFRHITSKADGEDPGIQVLPVLLRELENDAQYAFLQPDGDFQRLLANYRLRCGD